MRGEERELFPLHFGEPADRRRAVEGALRPLDPAVADELAAQNARFCASPPRDRNVARLREGAAAVVTGQQVGLFLGPLYTLYKAASAVRIARALAEETGAPVVPVFWLQTE
ncbi:MAG TPA: bacillithiol biosynthesis BshC, partial [Vulgatibacter sp.]